MNSLEMPVMVKRFQTLTDICKHSITMCTHRPTHRYTTEPVLWAIRVQISPRLATCIVFISPAEVELSVWAYIVFYASKLGLSMLLSLCIYNLERYFPNPTVVAEKNFFIFSPYLSTFFQFRNPPKSTGFQYTKFKPRKCSFKCQRNDYFF